MEKLWRYASGSVGPVASAGAQFLLSLLLLRLAPAHEFGTFSFLLVTAQLMQGIWGALFCAPLLIAMTHGTPEDQAGSKPAIFGVSLILAIVFVVPGTLLALFMKLPLTGGLLFALYMSATLIRWVGRTDAFARGEPVRAMMSDVAYAVTLVAAIGVLLVADAVSIPASFGILLLSTVFGLAPLGRAFQIEQLFGWTVSHLGNYRETWRLHASWSLLGVATTEATANSQVYLVTALFGPAAFAPIAATALLVRPCNVAVNALSEFERAQMARAIGVGDVAKARSTIPGFRLILLAVWMVTALAVATLLLTSPGLLFPAEYSLETLATGSTLWLLVVAIRFARAPESSILQAAGAFRSLAFASVFSCAFSVIGVLVLLLLAGPLWSIAGTMFGEMVFAAWTWRQARRLQLSDSRARGGRCDTLHGTKIENV